MLYQRGRNRNWTFVPMLRAYRMLSILALPPRHAAGMPFALRILAICPAWSFQW
jgi:hypothetical protein